MADELAHAIADARPDGDPVARSVRRARVTAALFGQAAPVAIGRYELRHQLARGGGGTVYVARDPELDRDVALKLIAYASDAARERALAEGRTLAKLAHPNVVPVFDVGATATHVYLVMELIAGPSLRDRANESRDVRELVGAYREAGLGLAAAHDVGVIHRDFKPDNAILGPDGRVRVVDFGLAITAGDAAAVRAGTPRYMAPEQHAREQTGEAIGPAADQYALAVSLREALGARVPGWLGRVLDRATANEPARRYPELRELVRALGHDPRRTWLRRTAIGAPVLLAAIGFVIGRDRGESGPAPCSGAAELLAPAWSVARVDAASAQIATLGTPFAAAIAPLVRERARAAGEAWVGAHRRACLAHQRRELSDELHDRAAVCLGRARNELGETLDLLETKDPMQLEPAVTALGLVDPAACSDPVTLARQDRAEPTPQTRELDRQIEMAQLHTRAATGRARALAEAAVRTARALGDPVLLARALLVLGHDLLGSDRAAAVAPLEEATALALANGRDDLAAEAHARKMWAAGFAGKDPLRPLDSLALAKAIGQRAGDRGVFARALLANNAGSLKATAGQFELARADFREALALGRDVSGPEAVELVTTVSNLAAIAPDRAERTRLYASAVASLRARVGPDHSQTLIKQMNAVLDDDRGPQVARELATLCPRIATLHPQLRASVESCAFELAWQATATGEVATAARAVELGRDPARAGETRQLLLAAYGDLAAADLGTLEAARDRETAKIAELGWFQHFYANDVELAIASAALTRGDRPRARRAATAALAHLERIIATTGAPYGTVLRRRARAEALVRDSRQ